MNAEKTLFEEALRRKLGAGSINWDHLNEKSLAEHYGLPCSHWGDSINALRHHVRMESGVFPDKPGILQVSLPANIIYSRLPDGDHIPYPVQFIEALNLGSSRQELEILLKPKSDFICYGSYAIVSNPEERSILISALRNKLKEDMDSNAIPAFYYDLSAEHILELCSRLTCN